MKVFLDTNIILDLLLEREGFEDSIELFSRQDNGEFHLCTSVLSMVNIAYVYRKTVGNNMAVANLKYLSALLEVLPMDEAMLQEAILSKGKDFEDNLQWSCARAAQCDYLITRNTKDFLSGKSSMKVCSPAGFFGIIQTDYQINQTISSDNVLGQPPSIRDCVFWDINPSTLDWNRHKDFILARVHERGNKKEIDATEKYYKSLSDSSVQTKDR